MNEHLTGIVAVRITPLNRSTNPESYYLEINAAYYARHLHSAAEWGGRYTREKLSLEGVVKPDDFASVLRNKRPGQLTSITPRTRVNRSAGYDMTFHVPKSVSVMALVAGDTRIIRAFADARNVTLSLAETYAETRVRKCRSPTTNETRSTGNLLYATFMDSTARPVRGSEADPHLHSHVVVVNATWDQEEERWKALQGFGLKSAAPMLQAVFHTDFANRLRSLGYQLRWNGPRFEVEGVSDDIVERFSKRTGTINQFAEAHGIFLADERGQLGGKTRCPKGPEKTWKQLIANWQGQLTADEYRALVELRQSAEAPRLKNAPDLVTPTSAVEGAVRKLAEHAWCWSRSTAIVETLYAGRGFVSKEAAENEFEMAVTSSGKHASNLIQLDRRTSLGYSRELLAQLQHSTQGFVSKSDLDQEEQNVKENGAPKALERVGPAHPLLMGFSTETVFQNASVCVRLASENKGTYAALGPKFRVTEMVGNGHKLALEQSRTIRRLLKSRDFVVALKAPAGRGRTALLRAFAVDLRRPVFAIAGNAQSCTLLAIDGFSGTPLVGTFLRDYTHFAVPKKCVLIVDEAGTVGSEDMLRLLQFGQEGEHRIILVGGMPEKAVSWDTDSLRLFARSARLNVVAVRKMAVSECVTSAAPKDRLGKASGSIITQPNLGQRVADAAAKIVEFVLRRLPFLAFAFSRRDAETLTRAVRDSLFELPRKRITVERWAPKITVPVSLAPGDIVELVRESELGARGEILHVSRVGDEIELRALSDNSLRRTSSEVTPEMIKVFEPIPLEVQVGDRIRLDRSTFCGPRLLVPGDIVEVADIAGAQLALKGGNLIPTDFHHLSYGWVTTPDAVTPGAHAQHVVIFHSLECGKLATFTDEIARCTARSKKEVWLFADDARQMIRQSRPLPLLPPTINIFDSPQAPAVAEQPIAADPPLSGTSQWGGPAWFKEKFFIREEDGSIRGPILGSDMAWRLDFGKIEPDAIVTRNAMDGDWRRADEDPDLRTYCPESGSQITVQSSEQEPKRLMAGTSSHLKAASAEPGPDKTLSRSSDGHREEISAPLVPIRTDSTSQEAAAIEPTTAEPTNPPVDTSKWGGPAWLKEEFFVREQDGNIRGPILGGDMARRLELGAIAPDALVARNAMNGDWRRANEDPDLRTYCPESGSRSNSQSPEQEPIRLTTRTSTVVKAAGAESGPDNKLPRSSDAPRAGIPAALVPSGTGSASQESVAPEPPMPKPISVGTDAPHPIAPEGTFARLSKTPEERSTTDEPSIAPLPQPNAPPRADAGRIPSQPPPLLPATTHPALAGTPEAEISKKKPRVAFGRYRKSFEPHESEEPRLFFYQKGMKEIGPVSITELKAAIVDQSITPATLVRRLGGGMGSKPAGSFTELIPLLVQAGHQISSTHPGAGISL